MNKNERNKWPSWWPVAITALIFCGLWFAFSVKCLGGTYTKEVIIDYGVVDADSVLVEVRRVSDTAVAAATDSETVITPYPDTVNLTLDSAVSYEIQIREFWYGAAGAEAPIYVSVPVLVDMPAIQDSLYAILDTLQLWDTRIDSIEAALADANIGDKVWTDAGTRTITGGALTTPGDYKADVSALALASGIDSIYAFSDSLYDTLLLVQAAVDAIRDSMDEASQVGTGLDSATTSRIIGRKAWGIAAGSGSDSTALADRKAHVESMKGNVISANEIAANAITNSELATGAITTAAFAAGAIDAAALADDAIDYATFAASAPSAWWNEGKTGYEADMTAVSGDATAADNLEAMLDGTRAKLYLSQLSIVAAGNDNAIDAQGSGSGEGMYLLGGATGFGQYIRGGATSGHGQYIYGPKGMGSYVVGEDGNNAVTWLATNGGEAFQLTASGTGTGQGLNVTSAHSDAIQINAGDGDNKHAIELRGGTGTGGDPIRIVATTGDGIDISADAGRGIYIDATGGNAIELRGDTGLYVLGDVSDIVGDIDPLLDSTLIILDSLEALESWVAHQSTSDSLYDSLLIVLDSLEALEAWVAHQTTADSLYDSLLIILDSLEALESWVAHQTTSDSILDSVGNVVQAATIDSAAIDAIVDTIDGRHGSGSYEGAAGTGEYSVTIVSVDTTAGAADTSITPKVNFVVRNAAQTTMPASGQTDVNGEKDVNLDATDYVIIANKSGYTWPTYDTHTVAGTQTDTIWGIRWLPEAPSDTFKCRLWGYVQDIEKNAVYKATLTVTPIGDTFNICDDVILASKSVTTQTHDSGYFQIDVLRSSCRANAKYDIKLTAPRTRALIGSKPSYTVPDSATHKLVF